MHSIHLSDNDVVSDDKDPDILLGIVRTCVTRHVPSRCESKSKVSTDKFGSDMMIPTDKIWKLSRRDENDPRRENLCMFACMFNAMRTREQRVAFSAGN